MACADLILINKTDLLDEAAKAKVEAQVLAEKRPAAQIMWTTQGQADPRALLGLGLAAEDDLDSRPSHHDGADEHEHDDFDSCIVTLAEGLSKEALLAKCQAAVAQFGLYRMKGFAAIPGADMRLTIQGVGERFDAYFDRDWAAGELKQTRLVAIGAHGLDMPGLQAFMSA